MVLFFIRCIEYFDGVVLWCGLHHDNCCTTCFYTNVAFLGHFSKRRCENGHDLLLFRRALNGYFDIRLSFHNVLKLIGNIRKTVLYVR